MRSEGKKRTLELSLIQGFSKIEKLLVVPVGNEPRIIPGIYLPFPEGYINETLYVKFRPGYVQQGIQPLKDKVQAQLSSFTPLYIENLWVDMEGYLSKVIELGSMIFWLAVFCILISALGVYRQ